ncbi:hypothetical protein AOLI_G00010910 [Acnodon oligacanthus]
MGKEFTLMGVRFVQWGASVRGAGARRRIACRGKALLFSLGEKSWHNISKQGPFTTASYRALGYGPKKSRQWTTRPSWRGTGAFSSCFDGYFLKQFLELHRLERRKKGRTESLVMEQTYSAFVFEQIRHGARFDSNPHASLDAL